MALVSYTQSAAGQPMQFTMNKNALLAVPKVVADPFFSLESNWFRVSFVFKHTTSGKRFVPSFRNFSATKSLRVRAGMVAGDAFELKKIIISKSDRTHLVIRTNEIPSVASYNFALMGNSQEYRYVKVAVSKLRNNINNPVATDAVQINEFKARWNGGLHSLSAFTLTPIATPWSGNSMFGHYQPNVHDGIYNNTFAFIPGFSEDQFRDLFSMDLVQPRAIQSFELTVNGFWNIPLEYKIYGSNDNNAWTELVSEAEVDISGWGQKGFRKETVIGQSLPTYRYVKFALVKSMLTYNDTNPAENFSIQEFNLRFDNRIQSNLSQFTATELTSPSSMNTGQPWGNRFFSQIFDGAIINSGAGTEYYFTTPWGVETDLFKVDLGQARFIQDIIISSQPQYWLPREFKVYASNDQSSWTQILHVNDERWIRNATETGQWTNSYEADYGPSSGFRFLKVAAANGLISVDPGNVEYYNVPRDMYEISGISVLKDGTLLRLVDIVEATAPFPGNAQIGRTLSALINNQAVQGSTVSPYIFDRSSGVAGQFSDLFTVDIGRQIEFEEVRIKFGSAWNLPLNYKIFGSRDGSSWQLIAEEVETIQSWPNNGYLRSIKISPDMY